MNDYLVSKSEVRLSTALIFLHGITFAFLIANVGMVNGVVIDLAAPASYDYYDALTAMQIIFAVFAPVAFISAFTENVSTSGSSVYWLVFLLGLGLIFYSSKLMLALILLSHLITSVAVLVKNH